MRGSPYKAVPARKERLVRYLLNREQSATQLMRQGKLPPPAR